MFSDSQSWRDRQKKWQKEREVQFNPTSDIEKVQVAPPQDNFVFPEHHLVRVKIINSQYIFDNLGEGTINLKRQTNYIFDLSHPSNRDHQLIISRNPSSGSVRDLGIQGKPGSLGSLISIFIGNGRPEELFYYCTVRKGMGGRINLQPA
jgi:hypothetical protein